LPQLVQDRKIENASLINKLTNALVYILRVWISYLWYGLLIDICWIFKNQSRHYIHSRYIYIYIYIYIYMCVWVCDVGISWSESTNRWSMWSIARAFTTMPIRTGHWVPANVCLATVVPFCIFKGSRSQGLFQGTLCTHCAETPRPDIRTRDRSSCLRGTKNGNTRCPYTWLHHGSINNDTFVLMMIVFLYFYLLDALSHTQGPTVFLCLCSGRRTRYV
jgi:hypothetical protein